MMPVDAIRKAFKNYFKSHGHRLMSPASLVPWQDDSLLFTNSGMVRFKEWFGGATADVKRAVTIQPCIRAGGKHNDLDEVGYTTRHHTFFEMMGNFSFGDYFKPEAIQWAWQFITQELGVEKGKLFVTTHQEDKESSALWKKIANLNDDRIIAIGSDDNFWSMGDVGPCGYCTEIFYDYGEDWQGEVSSQGVTGERFVEIWNLVFMEYEMGAGAGKRRPLAQHGVDTGMGLERIATIMQGVRDNYETNELALIMERMDDMSRRWQGKNALFAVDRKVALKVITDHLRSSCALLAAGVEPSRDGRGYVLRRIMRRAMRYAHGMGCDEPVLHEMVPFVIETMNRASVLEKNMDVTAMTACIKMEEERFGATLERGLVLLKEQCSQLPKDNPQLSGKVAFSLYDTYGFPLEVTRDVMRRLQGTVDEKAYDKCMAKQTEQSRGNKIDHEDDSRVLEEEWAQNYETQFVGYDKLEKKSKIISLLDKGELVQDANNGDSIAIMLNETPFYGEQGGQEGDRGIFTDDTGAVLLTITDTQKKAGIIIHRGIVIADKLSVGMEVRACVDEARRRKLARYHTATHLLHEALRRHLGDHISQRGSLVAENRLRFDFSHSSSLSEEEIFAIEDEVNERIRDNDAVITEELSLKQAQEKGARALFGEKYGKQVRMVGMGRGRDKSSKNEGLNEHGFYSLELCGGTHVERTGSLGSLVIVGQAGVAAGVRRLEAAVAVEAEHYRRGLLQEARARENKLVDECTHLRKSLERTAVPQGDVTAQTIGAWHWLHKSCEHISMNHLRHLADDIKKGKKKSVITLLSKDKGRLHLVASVTADVSLDAAALVKDAVAEWGGSGGGRKDFAQGGIADDTKEPQLVKRLQQLIEKNEQR